MPAIKVDHIVSFSSEDPVHTANNILSTDSTKKWICRTPGEKQANVVLQLDKASQISSIDIGNEHSAYIEVLVSRSSNNDDFKVLLVTSAFMTPLEARQSQNVNKVRMFTQEQLCKPECDEKWDRIKVVCTQPFNKHVQFGLSFITLHSNESTVTNTPGQGNIGKFLIRPSSPNNLSAGTLFAKRKEYKQDEKPTAAAAIRDASSSPSLSSYASPSGKPKFKTKDNNCTPKRAPIENEEVARKDRNRNELFYTKEDEENNEKIDKIIRKKEEEEQLSKQNDEEKREPEQKRKKLFDDTDTKKTKKKKSDEDDVEKEKEKRPNLFNLIDKDKIKKKEIPRKKPSEDASSSQKKNIENHHKKKMEDTPKNVKLKKSKLTKPFNRLLDDVVLVISGIQNPDRANLRSMAMAMGASYKADWDSTSTHLICAFPNTPKFNQVKGKGKIVKESWIRSCHKERKKLPWRRFALDKSDLNQSESEEEIEESKDEPVKHKKSPKYSRSDSDNEIATTNKVTRKYETRSDSDNEIATTSKVTRKYETRSDSDNEHKAEGSDTEERIAKILEKNKRKAKKQSPKSPKRHAKDDDDDSSTDIELSDINKHNIDEEIENQITKKAKLDKKDTAKNSNQDHISTEEEITISSPQNQLEETIQRSSSNDPNGIFEADTDEESNLHVKIHTKKTPDIFHGDTFYVDHIFDEETYNNLRKYILAYNGKCVDETENVDVIVTTKEHSSTMKEINHSAKCVKHSWILQSHSQQKYVPINDFVF